MLRCVYYPGTGNFIVAGAGHKLLRYEGNCLYFWAGKMGEISVTLTQLQKLVGQGPDSTAAPIGELGFRNPIHLRD